METKQQNQSSSLRGANSIQTDIQSVANSIDSIQKPTTQSLAVKDSSNLNYSSPISSSQTNTPFFHHTKNSTTHPFSLTTSPQTPTYHTTLSLLLILHLLYLHQWNKRCKRQDVATNYNQLVNQSQYWRVVLAMLSHPPVDGDEYEEETRRDSAVESDSRFHRVFSIVRSMWVMTRRRIVHPLVFGHLSGLPLLIYVSHVLWSCRALEEVYDDHGGQLILGVNDSELNNEQYGNMFVGMASRVVWQNSSGNVQLHSDESYQHENNNSSSSYARVLIALATTSILLKISLIRTVLRRMDRHMDFTGYSTTPRTLLSNRAICSLTSLSAAVLSVYDGMFPYAPPPVLPFIRVSSSLSIMFSIAILCVLAHRIHPVTSVISGLLSGTLWALGVTSFLGTRYWGNVMILTLIGAMLLSLKSNQRYTIYLGIILPCLDYVAWDEEGDIHDPNTPDVATRHSRVEYSREENNNLDEIEMGQQTSSYSAESNDIAEYSDSQRPTAVVERQPLLSHATDSTLSNGSSVIRGRVPFINSMDSDFDDGSSAANNPETRMNGNLLRRSRGV